MNSFNPNQPVIDTYEPHYQLIAICEDSDTYPDAISANIISLRVGFDKLNVRDQLIVIKASIHTHYQILKGEAEHGKIIYYMLVDNTDIKIHFNIEGKLLD